MEKERYIVFRQYFTGIFWTYERIEMDKKTLGGYLSNHYEELKNIEVFSSTEKVDMNIEINLSK